MGACLWVCNLFHALQIDFAELPKIPGKCYLLVIVDQITGWPEAFPASKNDAAAMVKA